MNFGFDVDEDPFGFLDKRPNSRQGNDLHQNDLDQDELGQALAKDSPDRSSKKIHNKFEMADEFALISENQAINGLNAKNNDDLADLNGDWSPIRHKSSPFGDRDFGSASNVNDPEN